jgi:hypothetical protein
MEQAEATFANLPEDRFPQMRELAAPLAAPRADRHYYNGLSWLLNGISAVQYGDRP